MKNARWKTSLRNSSFAILLAIGSLSIPTAEAQNFQVIHTFNRRADGANPLSGLTLDSAGNLYGTARNWGPSGYGTVYRLKGSGSGWLFQVLHAFAGSPDGAYPQGRVSFGPDSALYGTTYYGGMRYECIPDDENLGCGTVFKLVPPAQICPISCTWKETVVYPFLGAEDGAFPGGDLIFDRHGEIYGTTNEGGVRLGMCSGTFLAGCGTVYKLSASVVVGSAHSIVYAFQGPGDDYADGVGPDSGVILDGAGNLYGTAPLGGLGGYNGHGVVYELTPSGGSWSEHILHSFTGGSDGGDPEDLISDQLGDLYGTAITGGMNGGGTLYELTSSDGHWSFGSLYSFPGNYGTGGNLTMDDAGNFYGTTGAGGAYGYGAVFKLTSSSSGHWTFTSLHDFTGGSDGGRPYSKVILDANGNLYGTAYCGGDASCLDWNGDGVVWEITP